jgi:methionine-rich copper-binding protein CopC
LAKKIIAAVAALSFVMVPLPANAHAQLVTSNPRISATVYKLPTQVSLTFDDDLIALGGSNVIEVLDPKNKKIQSGATSLSQATISTKIKPSTILGKYKVIWRALSGDGHPVSGFYYFYLAKKK